MLIWQCSAPFSQFDHTLWYVCMPELQTVGYSSRHKWKFKSLARLRLQPLSLGSYHKTGRSLHLQCSMSFILRLISKEGGDFCKHVCPFSVDWENKFVKLTTKAYAEITVSFSNISVKQSWILTAITHLRIICNFNTFVFWFLLPD